jgi:hypothetical protein
MVFMDGFSLNFLTTLSGNRRLRAKKLGFFVQEHLFYPGSGGGGLNHPKRVMPPISRGEISERDQKMMRIFLRKSGSGEKFVFSIKTEHRVTEGTKASPPAPPLRFLDGAILPVWGFIVIGGSHRGRG